MSADALSMQARGSLLDRLVAAYIAAGKWLARYIEPIFNLGVRYWMANIFFASGLIRLRTWSKQPGNFENYHPVPPLPSEVAAYITTVAELVLPVLLLFGIATRVPAAGMLIMAMVIEFIAARTPQGIEAEISNPQHYLWMFLLGYLVIRGGSVISVDWAAGKLWGRKR